MFHCPPRRLPACMSPLFHGLKAGGYSLLYALTPTIGKTERFLKVLMERCWLDLRNTLCVSSSSWGTQFSAVCYLGEARENNMKMIYFSLQLTYLVLAGKEWRNKRQSCGLCSWCSVQSCLFMLLYLYSYSCFSVRHRIQSHAVFRVADKDWLSWRD